MPRPRYQIADADVAVVHRWVRSKFPETAPLDPPTTEQLLQWCDQFLNAAQWKQLHAVIRAARREASHQTHTVRLSTRASALLHDLAAREQLTLSETIERYLPAVTMTPTHQAPPPLAEQPPVQQAAARTGAPKKVRAPRRHHRWEAIGQGTPATCTPLLAGAWDDGLEARKDKATPLFPTRTGRRLSRREATAIIQRIAAQANGRLSAEEQSDVSPHVLRHTLPAQARRN